VAHFTVLADQNPIIPNGPELVLGLFAFAIVFAVFYRKLLPNIQKTLAERTNAIEGGIQRAAEAEAEAQALRERHRAQLEQGRQEAARFRQEAQEQGSEIIKEMREEGQRQRETIVAAGHAQIDAEVKTVRSALQQDIGKLAIDLAGRIVGESVADEARQRRIVDRFLEDLEARAAESEAEQASA
jgi:F-type H+-transporting ATPase subunit b